MISKIPILNIYYLLSYAWDLRPLQGLGRTAAETAPTIQDLLARLFAQGVTSLRQRGLDQGYVEVTDCIPMIRGKPDFASSNKTLSRLRSRMICHFEELRQDILPNQILKSTLTVLLASRDLDPESHRLLHIPREILRDINPVAIGASLFRRVSLHRNNRHYRFLLDLCELIHKCFQATRELGVTHFRNFMDDEACMSAIYEKFVFNFISRHFPEAHVNSEWIAWDGGPSDERSRSFLPAMHTDVSVSWPDRKLILDCKFYEKTTISRYDAERIRSGHLYQIFSYLKNKAVNSGWEHVEGVLLYPKVDTSIDCRFNLGGHPVRAVTIDLHQPWKNIHADLVAVISLRHDAVPASNPSRIT